MSETNVLTTPEVATVVNLPEVTQEPKKVPTLDDLCKLIEVEELIKSRVQAAKDDLSAHYDIMLVAAKEITDANPALKGAIKRMLGGQRGRPKGSKNTPEETK